MLFSNIFQRRVGRSTQSVGEGKDVKKKKAQNSTPVPMYIELWSCHTFSTFLSYSSRQMFKFDFYCKDQQLKMKIKPKDKINKVESVSWFSLSLPHSTAESVISPNYNRFVTFIMVVVSFHCSHKNIGYGVDGSTIGSLKEDDECNMFLSFWDFAQSLSRPL